MSTRIIDGKAVAASVCDQVQQDVLSLAAQGVTPGLAVVLVGEDPASAVYVRNKAAACKAVGVHSEQIKLPASVSQAELLEHIQRLNANQNIHGILVQLPLPQHIDAQAVISTIAPHKDVDGFHLMNAGALMTGLPGFWPCTPHGCLKLLDSIDFDLRGKHAVVVGRSNIVGKPMAMMLLARNATVTICHSASRDLPDLTRQADVLVAAVGKPRYIRADMLQPGVVVLDVGINRLPDGKLCGDVDFDEVAQGVASAITPVPGGVGPMTIAMLLVNTLEAAQKSLI